MHVPSGKTGKQLIVKARRDDDIKQHWKWDDDRLVSGLGPHRVLSIKDSLTPYGIPILHNSSGPAKSNEQWEITKVA